jgi:hypothetical protein
LRYHKLAGCAFGQLGEAEVEHFYQAITRDHDVRGLQIAVNDAGGMCFRQRIGDLDGTFQCFIEPQPLAPDHLVERFARHVFHGDEVDAVGLRDVVDVNDVGMVKSGYCLGLLYEPPLSLGIGDFLGRQNLDGDEPVQVRVPGLVHHAHSAVAERFDDMIVQDGASDHGTKRIFGTRVKLYRGGESLKE